MVATPTADVPAAPIDPWPWLSGLGGSALLVLLWTRYRRDEERSQLDTREPEVAPEDTPAPPPIRRTGAPWLTATLRPVRAGLNMITAVADCEVTVVNEGGSPAEAVRTALTLLAAGGNQQAEAIEANAGPIIRPVVPAFTLQPGEARTFRGVASANLDGLPTMTVAGREMLVPLVLLDIRHRDPQSVEHRTSQGFVVGVERVDSAKLAPFWLDTIRMFDQVAARPGGAPERRRAAS